MKKAALLVLLAATLKCSCVGASLNIEQEQEDVVASLEIIYLENDALHLKWNLLKPTGAVRGFSLNWNDGATDKHAHKSESEASIDYPSNLDCSDKLTVTVIPLNDDNVPIGVKFTEKFDLNDVVTNIVLTPEENMISASWSLKCPSQVHTETVVIWEEVSHRHEVSCRYPSTARDTTADAICPAGELVLQPCQNYYVFIEPLDSESSYTGIAGRGMSYTLEEESCSKLVDIELKGSKPRSATLLWKGPNPECPGTNYVVKYTETRLEDGQTHNGEAKIVKGSKWGNQTKDQLITAYLHRSDDSKVMGHVDNLHPFSRYEFCFAAGSGTNFECQEAQTLEEKPDRPSHISLTPGQHAPITIEVVWEAPSNMNGIFANYIVRWYRDSNPAGSYNTTKHSYTIVDADPCVNYTIAVAAVNGAGEGMAAETKGVADNGDCHQTTCAPSSTASSVVHDVIREPAKEDLVLSVPKERHHHNEGNNWQITFIVLAATVVLIGAIIAVVLVVCVLVRNAMRQPPGNPSPANCKNRTLERSNSLDTEASVPENSESGSFLDRTEKPNY